MFYDADEKCVKFYNGEEWSKCFADKDDVQISFETKCIGFDTRIIEGTSVSTTYTVEVLNNSFTTPTINFSTSDLTITEQPAGASLTVTAVSPASQVLNIGQKVVVEFTITGTIPADTEGEKVTATFAKLALKCDASATIIAPEPILKIGTYGGSYSLTDSRASNFRAQIENPTNYGPNGIFTMGQTIKVEYVDFGNSNVTAQQLAAEYKILWLAANSISTPGLITKAEDYVKAGGYAVFVLENLAYASSQAALVTAFGFRGPLLAQNVGETKPAVVNNNGPFGNPTGGTIAVYEPATIVVDYEPINSTFYLDNTFRKYVFAQTTPAEYNNKVMWLPDSNMYFNTDGSSGVNRGYVSPTISASNPNSVFMNNLLVVILKAIGY